MVSARLNTAKPGPVKKRIRAPTRSKLSISPDTQTDGRCHERTTANPVAEVTEFQRSCAELDQQLRENESWSIFPGIGRGFDFQFQDPAAPQVDSLPISDGRAAQNREALPFAIAPHMISQRQTACIDPALLHTCDDKEAANAELQQLLAVIADPKATQLLLEAESDQPVNIPLD